jgi:hypothetical protein
MQNAGTWDSLTSQTPHPARTDRSIAPTPYLYSVTFLEICQWKIY